MSKERKKREDRESAKREKRHKREKREKRERKETKRREKREEREGREKGGRERESEWVSKWVSERVSERERVAKVIGIIKSYWNVLKEALLEAVDRNCGLKKSPVRHREKIVVEWCQ